VLYQNESWAPARATTDADVPTGDVAPLPSAVGTDLVGAEPLEGAAAPEGTVLLAEAFDDGWSATAGEGTLDHGAAFGWVNGWDHPAAGPVSIAHDGQAQRYLLLGIELLVWIAALVWWSRGRSRDRSARIAALRQERLERAPRPSDFSAQGDLAGLDDLDGFWDEQ